MALIDGSNVTISHLGVVAGVYDSLGIGDLIDELIPKKRHPSSLMTLLSKHFSSILSVL